MFSINMGFDGGGGSFPAFAVRPSKTRARSSSGAFPEAVADSVGSTIRNAPSLDQARASLARDALETERGYDSQTLEWYRLQWSVTPSRRGVGRGPAEAGDGAGRDFDLDDCFERFGYAERATSRTSANRRLQWSSA